MDADADAVGVMLILMLIFVLLFSVVPIRSSVDNSNHEKIKQVGGMSCHAVTRLLLCYVMLCLLRVIKKVMYDMQHVSCLCA